MNVTVLKNANSPFYGPFHITQGYKGNEHDGYDMFPDYDASIPEDQNEIHSTVNGVVTFADYENPADTTQGFGLYVVIKNDVDGNLYHFAHLSKKLVSVGQRVKITDVIGIMGNTGKSTGSHLHYCVRTTMAHGSHLDIEKISGIPNKEQVVYDDGYRNTQKTTTKKTIEVEIKQDGVTYSGTLTEK